MKKLIAGTIMICAILLFTSCAGLRVQDNPGASFQIKNVVDQTPPLKVGDPVVVTVTADRDCYLHVYYLSGSGNIRQIFPDNRMSGNMIRGGTKTVIPPYGSNYMLTLMHPPVQESILSVATLEPLNPIPQHYMDYSGVIPRIKMSHRQFDRRIAKSLEKILPTTWAVDRTYFTYGP
ncbi:exported hypothetical protein [Desulfamplus magnetovallimortis]|uniref:DUF4384 domain-containing protein n=1 Tax=Desulfamplus magnetovallimortis TaxID=1246637 RepID=A0A1W1H529_9BACT|nr:DUF4384 domain-containing protein [Desulfamplus magnetovallimortis]SLM27485.1 exported hypothetical protein [Desulfamplus magnetovallimortis]